jgi:hypothetical protein
VPAGGPAEPLEVGVVQQGLREGKSAGVGGFSGFVFFGAFTTGAAEDAFFAFVVGGAGTVGTLTMSVPASRRIRVSS